jgi:hypothetical protein
MKRLGCSLLIFAATTIYASVQAEAQDRPLFNRYNSFQGGSHQGPPPLLGQAPIYHRAQQGAPPQREDPNGWPVHLHSYLCITDDRSCSVQSYSPKQSGDRCECGDHLGSIDLSR